MKLTHTLLLTATLFSFSTASVLAAESEVTWSNVEKYRDIKAAQNDNQHRFKERTFAALEKHFAKLAAKLPEGQKLSITVTDVDLAGDVHAGGIQRIRVITEIYHPRITFSYQLKDANGEEILADEINLKDMNFMSGSQLKYQRDFLGHEKKMLDKWFEKTFDEHIVK